MSSTIYTSRGCDQCKSMLKDPVMYELQKKGEIMIFDVEAISPHLRERVFLKYNPGREVPFYVGGSKSSKVVTGKDNILAVLKR